LNRGFREKKSLASTAQRIRRNPFPACSKRDWRLSSDLRKVVSPEQFHSRRQALVLDDQPTNRESLTKQLLSWRVDVTESDNPEAAISILRGGLSNGRPFDFAIIDHEIYSQNGLDIARVIHTEKDLAQVRLILVSTFGQRPPKDAIIAAGVTASLTKPIRQSQLYDCLVNVMKDQFPGASGLKSQSAPGSATQMRDKQAPSGYEHVRLLVVEDNPINQEVARYQIEKLGYSLDVAKDGKEALAMLDQRDYGLILMDCHMPVMDGFEATSRIRKRADNKRRIPIIAVTASGTVGEREKCLQAGMSDFLLKPFQPEGLSEKIISWLSGGLHVAPNPKSANGEGPSDIMQDVTKRLEELEEDYGKEMVLKILEMFIPDAEVRIAEIDRAIKREEFRALEEAAHGLKSGAANIGATDMSQLCEQLETQGELGQIGNAAEVMRKLVASWAEVRTLIEH
jgi:CheY-like chemotaxis protein